MYPKRPLTPSRGADAVPKNPDPLPASSTNRSVRPVNRTPIPPRAPGSPPPVITFTRGRRRTVNTQAHFCPVPDCSYYGWLGLGNLRANGHPGGKPWRQLQCVSCHGYFYETHGTIFHGKRSSPDLIVRVIAYLLKSDG